ncbi:MAG: glutamate racemase [Ferruginibacter sp.]
MEPAPIGIFDSGYGGLTVLKEIKAVLPQYDYLYLGDNARAPYGTRSFDTVYAYTLESVKWFFNHGCQLVVLACNTASAKALRSIQQKDLEQLGKEKRVLGVIRPTAETIGALSETGHIGVMGTSGTVQSGSYVIEIKKYFPAVKVNQEACPIWVPLVETNENKSPGADYFIIQHIENLLEKDPKIDTILLACTHYPLLMDKIRQFTPGHIRIVSQGNTVAQSLKNYLLRHPEMDGNCSKNGGLQFFTTGDVVDFENHGTSFFGEQIKAQKTSIFQ